MKHSDRRNHRLFQRMWCTNRKPMKMLNKILNLIKLLKTILWEILQFTWLRSKQISEIKNKEFFDIWFDLGLIHVDNILYSLQHLRPSFDLSSTAMYSSPISSNETIEPCLGRSDTCSFVALPAPISELTERVLISNLQCYSEVFGIHWQWIK